MRLLVTGVSGLLGLNLALQVADRFQVTGVLRGKRCILANGRAPFETALADLTLPGEAGRLLEQVQPDVLVHCAALTNVDHCEADPQEAERVNAWLPGELARAAARVGVHMVHISSDAIFDGRRGNYTEADAPNPINVYARTKLEGERAVEAANPDALIARMNFYGWSWQGTRSLAEFFFNKLAAGQPVSGFTDLVFCPLLVNDMIEILLRMIELRLSGIYHVVSSEYQSKFAFARMLAREFGFDEELVSPASHKTGGLVAARSPLLTLRSDKLARALGRELPAQEPGMRRFVELYRRGFPQALRSVFVEPDHSLAG
jgi:dTDP-4-dehydrorhamnose reductase